MNEKKEIHLIWTVEDVLTIRPDLTAAQAMAVLESVEKNHDAAVGVNWGTLKACAGKLYPPV